MAAIMAQPLAGVAQLAHEALVKALTVSKLKAVLAALDTAQLSGCGQQAAHVSQPALFLPNDNNQEFGDDKVGVADVNGDDEQCDVEQSDDGSYDEEDSENWECDYSSNEEDDEDENDVEEDDVEEEVDGDNIGSHIEILLT